MSRRPLLPIRGAVARRDGRMMPGGRMWAESPVRSLRGRVAGESVPATYVWYGNSSSATTLVLPTGSTTDDLVVWVTQGYGGQATPPSGWTTVESGSNGDLNWLVASRILTGSDSLTASFAATWNTGRLWTFRGAGGVEVVNFDTYVGTQWDLPATGIGTFTWQIVGFMVTAQPLFFTKSVSPEATGDAIWISGISTYGAYFNTMPDEADLAGTITTTESGEWVRFSLAVT